MLVRTAIAFTLATTTLACAPSSVNSPAAPSPGSSDELTSQDLLPELAGGLLTAADLPAGYQSYTRDYQPYDSSSDKPCSSLLDELEFNKPQLPGVEYASVGFSQGQFGPWIVETLRRYPSAEAAKRDVDPILARLRGGGAHGHRSEDHAY